MTDIQRRRPIKWMKLVRRTHMYAGLLLFPWVVLYGVTALLFNHPGALSPRQVEHIDSDVLDRTALSDRPDAEALAEAVASQLREAATEAGHDVSGWGTPEGARLVGKWQLRGKSDDFSAFIRIEGPGGGGTAYLTPVKPDAPLSDLEGFEAEGLGVPSEASDFEAVAQELDLPVDSLKLQRGPSIMFDIPTDDGGMRVAYELVRKDLEVEDLGAKSSVQVGKSLLLELHTTHVYPGTMGARWIWSLFVDFMGLLMLTWAVTGVMMWWQMKKLRRVGLIVFVAGVGVMTVLATQLFTLYGY